MGLSQALTDVVYKIDARLKVRRRLCRSDEAEPQLTLLRSQKIVSLLSQEFDGIARAAIKTELNSLLG